METKPQQKTPDQATIDLGDGIVAIVDADDLPSLNKYRWRAVKSARLLYAKTTIGKRPHRYDMSMHRLIARTPRKQVCHHINHNSLDNRRTNLVNMDPLTHTLEHIQNNFIVKFAKNER